MSTKLHVGNIPSTASAEDLKSTFGQFGVVDSVEIAIDENTGLRRGFAIVSMVRSEDATTAIGRLNFSQYDGRTIGVSRSRTPRQ